MKKTKFKIYVSRYKDLVYSQAYYFTNNAEDADDITQDVLIKLWHHLDSISHRAMKSWLLKVTKNLCIDRSRKKRELTASVVAANSERNEFQLESVDEGNTPEEQMIFWDNRARLMAAIQKLPEKVRTVIIMREIQDLKYEEIAKTLDMPINSVKVYLHRGRKMLFDFLKPYYQRG